MRRNEIRKYNIYNISLIDSPSIYTYNDSELYETSAICASEHSLVR